MPVLRVHLDRLLQDRHRPVHLPDVGEGAPDQAEDRGILTLQLERSFRRHDGSRHHRVVIAQ